MVEIGGKPILWHIMEIYQRYGYREFLIALGYRGEIIKEYFLNYHALNSNFSVNLSTGDIDIHDASNSNITVTLIDTGLATMTGGRISLLEEYVGGERFFVTYGDEKAVEIALSLEKTFGEPKLPNIEKFL